jgi:hypothetical protein
MKIIGSVFGNGAMKNIGGSSSKKVSSETASKRSDSVEISRASAERTVIEDGVKIDFQPRPAEVNSAAQKVADNEYNSRDMIETVAKKLFDADIALDIIKDTREVTMDSEKVETINQKIADNFYDSQGVRQEIAGKVIDVIDVSGLFGNDTSD